jgi:hypothetical protein
MKQAGQVHVRISRPKWLRTKEVTQGVVLKFLGCDE